MPGKVQGQQGSLNPCATDGKVIRWLIYESTNSVTHAHSWRIARAPGAGAVRADRSLQPGTSELAHSFRKLQQPALQYAVADHSGECEESRSAVDFPGTLARKVRSDADCRRRHHVHRRSSEQHCRAGRRDRSRLLDIHPYSGTNGAAMLRTRESGPGDSWRYL